MELRTITDPDDVPQHLRVAVKSALAVGAACSINTAGDAIAVKFKGSDSYNFDPLYITLHCIELLHEARTHGFVYDTYRMPLIVRVVYCAEDVRVQIGASRWYQSAHRDTAAAFRTAIVTAFADYYDQTATA